MHHRWPSERATLFGSDVEVDGKPIIPPPPPTPPRASVWAEWVVSRIMELFAITLCTFKHFCLDLSGALRLIFLLLIIRCFMFGICQTSNGLAAGNMRHYTLIFISKALNLFSNGLNSAGSLTGETLNGFTCGYSVHGWIRSVLFNRLKEFIIKHSGIHGFIIAVKLGTSQKG